MLPRTFQSERKYSSETIKKAFQLTFCKSANVESDGAEGPRVGGREKKGLRFKKTISKLPEKIIISNG